MQLRNAKRPAFSAARGVSRRQFLATTAVTMRSQEPARDAQTEIQVALIGSGRYAPTYIDTFQYVSNADQPHRLSWHQRTSSKVPGPKLPARNHRKAQKMTTTTKLIVWNGWVPSTPVHVKASARPCMQYIKAPSCCRKASSPVSIKYIWSRTAESAKKLQQQSDFTCAPPRG